MKRYSAAFTESTKKDIKESVDYIEFSLHNPSAADRLMDKIDEELKKSIEKDEIRPEELKK